VFHSVQAKTLETCLPELQDLGDQERWISQSAAKMIQDRFDMQKFNLQAYLPLLDYAENPNHEDIDNVKAFNKIIQNSYNNKDTLDFQDYYSLWTNVGLSPETAGEMVGEMERMTKDMALVRAIKGSYSRMLEQTTAQIN
jgi:hypothetical protein